MSQTSHFPAEMPRRSAPHRLFGGRLSRAFLRRLLSRMTIGRLTIHMPGGDSIDHIAPHPGPHAIMLVHNWRVVRRLVLDGQVGFAESYIDGDWSSPDLTALIELAARNQDEIADTLVGTRLARLIGRLQHGARANTKRGSPRNIEAHYDLGNAFYAEWLDAGMTYSSGLYEDGCHTLEAAQDAKQARVIDRLGLAGGERVLEIGCGWGGLAERLIRECGCHVTGLTLSPAQLEHASQRLEKAGLDGRHDLRLQDYRDVAGSFDRIVSIEMLEAVGAEYWPIYFDRLRTCMAARGRAVLQVITIAERYYDSYRRDPDFIQRHIFPGGMLPSGQLLHAQIERAGLALRSVEHFGASYAATLAEWQTRFQSSWPRLRLQGFDENFRRKWEYYLAYCEAGFRAGSIDVGLYEVSHAGGA